MTDQLPNKYLVLDISGNYSRVSRYALENNHERVNQFLKEANLVLGELKKRKLTKIGNETLKSWDSYFKRVHNPEVLDRDYVDDVITLESILNSRANLF
jgi:hypothetical protein